VVKVISPYDLRIKCECALCYDEFSGKKILNEQKIDKEVFPTSMLQKGNYALAITWSDGHRSSIYPYKNLEQYFKNK
jgi:ATP-binding protein involved in chromosome partitioning